MRESKLKGIPVGEGRRPKIKLKLPTGPIELPSITEEPDDHDVIDRHSRPSIRQEIEQLRREAKQLEKQPCARCYGSGYVAGSRFCGDVRTCPTCEGSGKVIPEPSVDNGDNADDPALVDGVLPILPGDVDAEPAKRKKRKRDLPGKPLGKRKKAKPKAKPSKSKSSDVPPWERTGDNKAPWD